MVVTRITSMNCWTHLRHNSWKSRMCAASRVTGQCRAQRVRDCFGDRPGAVRIGMTVVLDAVVGVERHIDVRQMRFLDDALPQLPLLALFGFELGHNDQRN